MIDLDAFWGLIRLSAFLVIFSQGRLEGGPFDSFRKSGMAVGAVCDRPSLSCIVCDDVGSVSLGEYWTIVKFWN